MNILATTGATAPFVGLVGTIFGIINAFSQIGSAGGGDLMTLAPAIGEALITTAFGIMVALVGVWIFNYFTGFTDKIINQIVFNHNLSLTGATNKPSSGRITNLTLDTTRKKPWE